MTGAVVKDMSQDWTKLLLVFPVCFHFIVYLLKKPQTKTATEKPLQSLTACVCTVLGTLIAGANNISVLRVLYFLSELQPQTGRGN